MLTLRTELAERNQEAKDKEQKLAEDMAVLRGVCVCVFERERGRERESMHTHTHTHTHEIHTYAYVYTHTHTHTHTGRERQASRRAVEFEDELQAKATREAEMQVSFGDVFGVLGHFWLCTRSQKKR
jgi:hypothetical protein